MPPHATLPKLSKRWEEGYHQGLSDPQTGLHYSILATAAEMDGKPRLTHVPKIHFSDRQLGLTFREKEAENKG
jgi:hypothetical protein